MRHLVFWTDESVLAGYTKSGIAEVVDSLANAMTKEYRVSVVCPDGNGSFIKLFNNIQTITDEVRMCRMFGVDYYLVNKNHWPDKIIEITNNLEPDILHSFCSPEYISLLEKRPYRAVLTFDNGNQVCGKEEYLAEYDSINTLSNEHAKELLSAGDKLARVLASVNFKGLDTGILTQAFCPEKGVLISSKFSADDLSGKALCKEKLIKTYGIPGDRAIYLMMCRIVQVKGVDYVIDAVHTIRDNGGFVIIVGRGDPAIEKRLANLSREDGALWIKKWPHPMQMIPTLAGADFYLCPSIHEVCGLMPMTACRYAAIPICTLNGGLKDNMGDDCAIVIGEGGMDAAVIKAAELYADKDAYKAKQRICMEKDFSWDTRKQGYLEAYGYERT